MTRKAAAATPATLVRFNAGTGRVLEGEVRRANDHVYVKPLRDVGAAKEPDLHRLMPQYFREHGVTEGWYVTNEFGFANRTGEHAATVLGN